MLAGILACVLGIFLVLRLVDGFGVEDGLGCVVVEGRGCGVVGDL